MGIYIYIAIMGVIIGIPACFIAVAVCKYCWNYIRGKKDKEQKHDS